MWKKDEDEDLLIKTKTGVQLCNYCKLPNLEEKAVIGRDIDEKVLTLKEGDENIGKFF